MESLQDKSRLMLGKLEGISLGGSAAGLFGAIVAVLAAASYYHLYLSRASRSPISTKGRQSKDMKTAFAKADFDNGSAGLPEDRMSKPTMEISQIWVYPIKSIRGCQVTEATLTKHGFVHDRNFMLLKVLSESPRELQNMAITKFPTMCLFHTAIHDGNLTVTYRPTPGSGGATEVVEIPLEPSNLGSLARVDVNMHGSPNRGYDMGAKYNEWFSKNFGFKVILAYWGGDARQVLGNLVPGKRIDAPKPKSMISNIAKYVPVIGPLLTNIDGAIAFNDCAPYLVITEKSAEDVTTRLPEAVNVDITKFRANIVLRGSEAAFVEDFWGELIIGEDSKIILTGNCGRCVSLNIDYATGKSGTGRDGQMLKLLATDRRVDPGMKYSPIFGRYGFASRRSEGKVVSIGDGVSVSRRNEERTRFYWPGIST